MLLVGYLFGITSERQRYELQMHVGYRRFVGLALDEKVPDHSTFSKNRHGRFKESGIHQQIFDQIVLDSVEKGLELTRNQATDHANLLGPFGSPASRPRLRLKLDCP